MKLGIVGLPNVGKSTLFNAITNAGAESANYPFCTIDPNVGVVSVRDPRLDIMRDIYGSERIIPAAIEFYDIAGLVKGASEGEGLGNQFLSHIREVDAIVEVIRCFEDDNISHVEGSIDPLRDIDTIETELILSDLEIVERNLDRAKNLARFEDSQKPLSSALQKLHDVLSEGKAASHTDLNDDEKKAVAGYGFLSAKPKIYVANVSADDIKNNAEENEHVKTLKAYSEKENSETIVISAQIEEEIAAIEDEEERKFFIEELGIPAAGLDQLVRASYALLGLISFITAGPREIHAWSIVKGTNAQKAAGKIHTDMEKGFIRAEIISFTDLEKAGSMAKARDLGLVRLEGRDYIMEEGDVAHFRFNV